MPTIATCGKAVQKRLDSGKELIFADGMKGCKLLIRRIGTLKGGQCLHAEITDYVLLVRDWTIISLFWWQKRAHMCMLGNFEECNACILLRSPQPFAEQWLSVIPLLGSNLEPLLTRKRRPWWVTKILPTLLKATFPFVILLFAVTQTSEIGSCGRHKCEDSYTGRLLRVVYWVLWISQ